MAAMMGKVSAQGNLFGGDCQHLDYVGRTTFYGWLATEGPRVYPDEDSRTFYALEHGFSRYFADVSLKGGAELDWESESERVAFLTGLVVDVRRALTLARSLLESADSFCGSRCGSAQDVREAMQLLEQLVDQDIEVRDDEHAHNSAPPIFTPPTASVRRSNTGSHA